MLREPGFGLFQYPLVEADAAADEHPREVEQALLVDSLFKVECLLHPEAASSDAVFFRDDNVDGGKEIVAMVLVAEVDCLR